MLIAFSKAKVLADPFVKRIYKNVDAAIEWEVK
jgi:hypothetical protein